MADRQPPKGYGSQYSGQLIVSKFDQADQGQPNDEDFKRAQAWEHVRKQVVAQLGDQRPAWDGPVPNYWDGTPQPSQQSDLRSRRIQNATTNFGQGQNMNEIPRAQFPASQQGVHGAKNWATAVPQAPGGYGPQHTQNAFPDPNIWYRQPATHTDDHHPGSSTLRPPGSQVIPSMRIRGGNNVNGLNSQSYGDLSPY